MSHLISNVALFLEVVTEVYDRFLLLNRYIDICKLQIKTDRLYTPDRSDSPLSSIECQNFCIE